MLSPKNKDGDVVLCEDPRRAESIFVKVGIHKPFVFRTGECEIVLDWLNFVFWFLQVFYG